MPAPVEHDDADAAAALHPGLWRASQVARPREPVVPSGFAALDEALPGGGWPAGVLTELLLPHPGVGELRLLAPVLGQLQRQQHERCLMWFDPPAQPCAWALQALGLSSAQMVVVRSQNPSLALTAIARKVPSAVRLDAPAGGLRTRVGRGSDLGCATSRGRSMGTAMGMLWALEHALRSGHVGAVLAWLPVRLPLDALRRLQLAAQCHEGPAFLLRDEAVAPQPSPAPLRLRLSAAAPDWLRVEIFKRRGPPLQQPLLLELPPVLGRAAQLQALTRVHADVQGGARGDVQTGLRGGLHSGEPLASEDGRPPEAAWLIQTQGSWA